GVEARGLDEDWAGVLFDLFAAAEASGRGSHGFHRIEWLETFAGLDPAARPALVVSEEGYERWRANGAVGYLVLDAVVRAQLERPPAHAPIVLCHDPFPTGMPGPRTRRLADAALAALPAADSP